MDMSVLSADHGYAKLIKGMLTQRVRDRDRHIAWSASAMPVPSAFVFFHPTDLLWVKKRLRKMPK